MHILPFVRQYWERIGCDVVVFDNGSEDGSVEYLSMFPYVTVRHFDSDEYITSTEPISSVLSRFNDHDGVLVYWKNYGVSGRLKKPVYDKPIYDIYTEPCGYELFSDFKYYKITKFCVNMNKWKPEHKYWIHNAPRNWIKADGTYKRTEIVHEPLYLRHYITKSVEEYLHKVYVRGMFHPSHRQLQSLYEMCPETKDMIDDGFREYFKNKYGVGIPE